ncbi:MAG: putative ABC exporter domain-containing protein [Clostridia bacterium]|nr:putative ABC exporter domain-containing protein [Clostridia bacterium]
MRAFFYYTLHSFKNQIRKLFRTWVAVFLVICIAFGVLIGLGGGWLDEAFGDEDAAVEEEEVLPEEEPTPAEQAQARQIAELVIGGIVLLILVFHVFASDKSGSAIFQPADVNLLFPSPMKPQSVLLFRLMAQIGSSLLVSIYFLFQLPSFVMETGAPAWVALAILGAWFLLLVLGKLLQILLYTVGTTHLRIKSYVRPITLGVCLVTALAFLLYWKAGAQQPLDAAVSFFNAPFTRFIPVWGWLKGICLYALDGNLLGALLSLFACILTAILLGVIIWHIRADFYEDALAKTEETAALRQTTESDGRALQQRKKDRSERLQRDGLRHGSGANVYFFKAMYNRFRFAHLHILTKTSETYLLVGVGGALLLRYYLQIRSIIPIALVLAALAFFRSLGNPLSEDTQKDLFLMIPESPWKKMIWSMLGGTVNCLLDLLPAMLAATLLLGANPLVALGWTLFIVSMDFYSTNVGVFIDLSLPTATSRNLRSLIQILFLYFGLIPNAILLIVGWMLSLFPLFALVSAAFNVGIGAIFFALSPMFVEFGRK